MSFNFTAVITICSDFGAPPKIKSDTVSTVSPSISHEVIGPDATILVHLDVYLITFVLILLGFFYNNLQ